VTKPKLEPGAIAGLLLAVLPWLLAPVAGFFLFFGDGPRDGTPDPRDIAARWYFAITGLVSLAAITLGLSKARTRPGVLIATVLLGGAWLFLAVQAVAMGLSRPPRDAPTTSPASARSDG